jgi:hypothetical protein
VGLLISNSQTVKLEVDRSSSNEQSAIIRFGWATAEVFPERYLNKTISIDGFIEINPSSPRYTLWIDESSLKHHRRRRSVELDPIEMDGIFKGRSTDDRWWTAATGECVEIVGVFKNDEVNARDYSFGLGYITQIREVNSLQGRRQNYSNLFEPTESERPKPRGGDPFNSKDTIK